MNIYLNIPHIIHSKLVKFSDFVGYGLDFLCVFTSTGEYMNLALGGVKAKVVSGFSASRRCI